MLSNACQYAIRGMLYLGIHSRNDKKIGAKEIAEALETPQPFLAKLLQKLSKNNLVSSVKGPNGGFYLKKENTTKTIWDIILCIDGSQKFDSCFMGLATCGDENPCPVHFTVAPFKKKLLQDFKEKSIAQFTEEIVLKGRYLSLKDVTF
jgi:Rrf2 family protein